MTVHEYNSSAALDTFCCQNPSNCIHTLQSWPGQWSFTTNIGKDTNLTRTPCIHLLDLKTQNPGSYWSENGQTPPVPSYSKKPWQPHLCSTDTTMSTHQYISTDPGIPGAHGHISLQIFQQVCPQQEHTKLEVKVIKKPSQLNKQNPQHKMLNQQQTTK